MKTLLHTADGKEYSRDYMDIFSSSRVHVRDILEEWINNIHLLKGEKKQCSLMFICIVAEYLTAYNELSSLDFFIKTRHLTM